MTPEEKRIKELEDGIKWALDNPQSVFVFNELQKLLNSEKKDKRSVATKSNSSNSVD